MGFRKHDGNRRENTGRVEITENLEKREGVNMRGTDERTPQNIPMITESPVIIVG